MLLKRSSAATSLGVRAVVDRVYNEGKNEKVWTEAVWVRMMVCRSPHEWLGTGRKRNGSNCGIVRDFLARKCGTLAK